MLLAQLAACRQATNWRTPSKGASAAAARAASSADAAALRSRASCMGPCQYSAAALQSLHTQVLRQRAESSCHLPKAFQVFNAAADAAVCQACLWYVA